MKNLFLIHFASCFTMLGAVWFVQIVHYPLLGFVQKRFKDLERLHILYTSFLAFPVMAVEGITGLLLALQRVLQPWFGINLLLLLITFIITFGFCFPTHLAFMQDFDPRRYTLLKRLHFLRCILWTVRGVLLLWISFAYHAGKFFLFSF